MISVITTLKNRADLLKWGLEGLCHLEDNNLITEINIADGGSTDNLEEVINEYKSFFKINKYTINRNDSIYNHKFNCPSLEYNFLVEKCSNDIIIKIDPEFVFLTPTFIKRGLSVLEQNESAFFMPFPYHTYDFEYNNIDDIKNNYLDHYYQTHLTEAGVEAGNCRLVYYGCMFNKKYFKDLGGIDVRFVEGIGSEDDHFFDQWERKYGIGSVLSTTMEKGVHLWHGEWAKAVPDHLQEHVTVNRKLRNSLNNTYPNNGDFSSVTLPKYSLTSY